MDLKLAKLLAFALHTADYQGVMAKSPREVLILWEVIDQHEDLATLIENLNLRTAAQFNNYLLIWAKEIGGLTEDPQPAPPVEAKNVPVEQSVKSESVIKESEE